MTNIISVPNQVLLTKAAPVGAITPKIKKLIAGMAEALSQAENPKGIGLAAPQVGVSLQIFLVQLAPDQPLHVFINPQILSESPELVEQPKLLEGCLSIPTIWGPVKRHRWVKVRFQNSEGKVLEKVWRGLMATTIQHEMDHLSGLLFTARVLEQKSKLYRTATDDAGKQVFKEVEL